MKIDLFIFTMLHSSCGWGRKFHKTERHVSHSCHNLGTHIAEAFCYGILAKMLHL